MDPVPDLILFKENILFMKTNLGLYKCLICQMLVQNRGHEEHELKTASLHFDENRPKNI